MIARGSTRIVILSRCQEFPIAVIAEWFGISYLCSFVIPDANYGGPHCLDQKTDLIRETGDSQSPACGIGTYVISVDHT